MKYVYLEVFNGFNDILCSMMQVYEWCKKHDRALIVNSKKGVYKVHFYDYFDIPGILLDPSILKDFQGTIHPPELQGKMNDILDETILFSTAGHDGFYQNKLELVDTDADVIIFSRGAGGYGLPMFQQIRFRPFLFDIMKERQRCLTPPYLCIHIRNTDFKCDYQKVFYQQEKKIRSFKEVYLCTDDVSSLDFYRGKRIPVKNFTTFPTHPYTSLHNSTIDPHIKMVDLFCDIYIAGLSQAILSNSEGGFIMLLRSIHDSMKVKDKIGMSLNNR